MSNHLRSIRLVALILGIVVLVSCVPEEELTVTAKFLANDQTVECPPICMEVDNPPSGPDTSTPISFEVCSSDTDCLQLESGQTARVFSDVTVRAPDGISRGQQLPTMEKDSYLKFMEWGDGNTDNPRSVGLNAGTRDLTAYYAAWEPLTVTSAATDRGCGNEVGIFLGTSAAWAPVADQPEYQIVQGPVTDSHVSDTDLYTNHNTNDVNTWILLSGEEQFSLLSEKNGQLGHRPSQIEVEWEEGSYPTWAWPSPEAVNLDEPPVPNIDDADLAWVKGTWIFDCAHQDSDIVQGAWTEIHPPIAAAVMRGTRQGKSFFKVDYSDYFPDLHEEAIGIEGVQVDLWINGDGGAEAVKSVKCAKAWGDGAGCIFSPVFDITGIYEFDIPLPPAPSPLHPEAQFRIEFLRLQPGQPLPEITPSVVNSTTDQLHLKLDLSTYKDTWSTCQMQNELPGEKLVNCQGDAYGVTIIAGWEVFEYPTDLHRVRLIVESVQILDDMEGEDGDGEYRLWLVIGPSAALTGDPLKRPSSSVRLDNINPDLNDAAGDGEAYPLIQNGSPLTFLFNIRENDTERNKLQLYLYGYEDDPISDDDLRDLLRIFYQGFVIPPGVETVFGTVRPNTSPPIPYSDDVRRIENSCINCFTHSLNYTIEELPPP